MITDQSIQETACELELQGRWLLREQWACGGVIVNNACGCSARVKSSGSVEQQLGGPSGRPFIPSCLLPLANHLTYQSMVLHDHYYPVPDNAKDT